MKNGFRLSNLVDIEAILCSRFSLDLISLGGTQEVIVDDQQPTLRIEKMDIAEGRLGCRLFLGGRH